MNRVLSLALAVLPFLACNPAHPPVSSSRSGEASCDPELGCPNWGAEPGDPCLSDNDCGLLICDPTQGWICVYPPAPPAPPPLCCPGLSGMEAMMCQQQAQSLQMMQLNICNDH